MRLHSLHLTDFRSYEQVDLDFPDGLTVITGPNGQGKTNLLEAIAYLATLTSLRGAPAAAMVRERQQRAVVRATTSDGDRQLLIEAELQAQGRGRVQVNRQPLRRARDLLGMFRVSVFAPDDLVLVKGGPAERRAFLDDALAALHPRHDATRSAVDRVLRQRTTLLRQAKGRLDESAATTLDVFDAKLAAIGSEQVAARTELLVELADAASVAFADVAGVASDVQITYDQSWHGELAAALAASRHDDVRRGATLVGPHRDEVQIRLSGLPARTHASQGEQRALALALRLAVHRLVAERHDATPVLLLDDVFSELDPVRARALVEALPEGQALLTCADMEPPGIDPALRLHVADGIVRPAR